MKSWAALVKWEGIGSELVEVQATNHAMAAKMVAEKLKTDYQPGGQVYYLEQVDSLCFGGVVTWSVQ